MRRIRTLIFGLGLGAYLGWRAARSGALGLMTPPRRSGAAPGTAASTERVRAVFDAGRERAGRLFGQVLGGRTGRAA